MAHNGEYLQTQDIRSFYDGIELTRSVSLKKEEYDAGVFTFHLNAIARKI